MRLTVYGIPNCGTVKKALGELRARGLDVAFVDFRQTPVDADRVARWVAHFGNRAMRNTSGGSFRALGPERETWTDAQWAAAFHADPMLVRRPVVERDGAPWMVGWTLDDAGLDAALA
jgi:arsenate reductase